MRGSPHPILFQKLQSPSGSMGTCLVRIDDQFSIDLPDLNFASNGNWTYDISDVMVIVKFGPPRRKWTK
jgi:hypothetical protein